MQLEELKYCTLRDVTAMGGRLVGSVFDLYSGSTQVRLPAFKPPVPSEGCRGFP